MALLKRNILSCDEEQVRELSARLGILYPVARALWNRGYHDPDAGRRYLEKKLDVMYDPLLLRDMDKAVAALDKAVEGGERITVYGDYDADGVTAVSILVRFLSDQGADVNYYIPSREGEGYGLNADAVDTLAAQGTKLIVTVDTGTGALQEAEKIYACGMRLIVTDHHECGDTLPRAEAVVNPRRHDETYPFRELAGVGVAFKLANAFAIRRLKGAAEKRAVTMGMCKRYAELVTVGTVADVMPLTDENRLFVNLGLAMMQLPKTLGLRELIDAIDAAKKIGKRRTKPITTGYISYSLAPRINAAGRIGSARDAADLFLTDDEVTAHDLAAHLCEINEERQAVEAEIFEQATEQIRRFHDLTKEKVLILSDDRWQQGVIGIVSSKITEKYGKPSFLISFRDAQDGVGRGSGRSVPGFDLFSALSRCSDCLERFGGHEMAAGLSCSRDNLDAFTKEINRYAEEVFRDTVPEKTITVDAELMPADVSLTLAEQLCLLEPFGVGNAQPTFLAKDVPLTEILPLGDGSHTKIAMRFGSDVYSAVWFSHAPDDLPFSPGDRADLVFTVDVNEFNGRRSAQMFVKELLMTEKEAAQYEEQQNRLSAFRAGGTGDGIDVPTREDYAAVFRHIRNVSVAEIVLPDLARKLRMPSDCLGVCLDVLTEAELIEVSVADTDTVRAALHPAGSGEKKDLTATPTARRLAQKAGL